MARHTDRMRPKRSSSITPRTNPAVITGATLSIFMLAAGPALAEEMRVTNADPVELGQADQAQAFTIAAQPLVSALDELSRQTDLSFAYTSSRLAGIRSPGASGTMTPREALKLLLGGTGVTYRMTGVNTAVLEAAGEGATVLSPITVEGQGQFSATTEGTGSYTTGPMRTATRLPLTIRETPQSVTVVTRQRMDDGGMSDITDVVREAPGLFLSGSDGTGRPAIRSRGFSVNNIIQDGLRVAHSSYIPTTLSSLAMYDRVEIVRGATGLYKGAGNPSAAINMVRKRPTKELHTETEMYTGSWNKVGGSFDIGGGLNENGTVRARMVVSGEDSDNFRVTEETQRKLFYGVVEADIDSATMFTFGVHHQRDNRNGGWWYSLPITLAGTHYGFDRDTSFANDWEYLDQNSTTVFAEVDRNLTAEWSMKAKAQANWMMTDGLGTYLRYDLAGANGYRQRAWRADQDTETYNLDVTADGPFALFGRNHDMVVGASHTRQIQTTQNYDGAYIANNIDILNFDNSSVARPNLAHSSEGRNIINEDSVHATARFNLFDPLSLITGARVDWYDYDDRRGAGDYYVRANLTRYAGLVYDIDNKHSAYASYTDIFSPQSSKDPNGKVLDPVVGENYEIGVKGEYFGGALNASAAVYRIDQKNRAVTVDDTSTCSVGTTCSTASGLVRSQGVDLEVQGAVRDNWQIGAGYTYVKAEYIEDASNAKGAPFDTRVPEHMFKLSTVYRFTGGDLDGWRVGGNLNVLGSIYADGTTNGVSWRNAQNAYAVTDLMVGYSPFENLDVQFNVNNVFDNSYYQSIGYHVEYGSTEIYGPPRNFLLKAKMTF